MSFVSRLSKISFFQTYPPPYNVLNISILYNIAYSKSLHYTDKQLTYLAFYACNSFITSFIISSLVK